MTRTSWLALANVASLVLTVAGAAVALSASDALLGWRLALLAGLPGGVFLGTAGVPTLVSQDDSTTEPRADALAASLDAVVRYLRADLAGLHAPARLSR